MNKNENLGTRDKIIRRAIFEKLSEGINFFSADDILIVAGIDDAQLNMIAESISRETQKAQAAKPDFTTEKKLTSKCKNKTST